MIVPDTYARDLESDSLVCGVDEAGRGALAGPLFAVGVSLSSRQTKLLYRKKLPLTDGKKLSRRVRRDIYLQVVELGIPFTVRSVSATVINGRGIQYANRESMRTVIRDTAADLYIVDGTIRPGRVRGKNVRIESVIRADAFVIPVILAGIIAKHLRDMQMTGLAETYPVYAWEQNAGYGTQAHISAIARHGASAEHRRLFVATALSHPRGQRHRNAG